jgi:hypothetical protein
VSSDVSEAPTDEEVNKVGESKVGLAVVLERVSELDSFGGLGKNCVDSIRRMSSWC